MVPRTTIGLRWRGRWGKWPGPRAGGPGIKSTPGAHLRAGSRKKEWALGDPCLCPSGKDHVCRFIGCGRNEKFNYVVMQLQVSPRSPPSLSLPQEIWWGHLG